MFTVENWRWLPIMNGEPGAHPGGLCRVRHHQWGTVEKGGSEEDSRDKVPLTVRIRWGSVEGVKVGACKEALTTTTSCPPSQHSAYTCASTSTRISTPWTYRWSHSHPAACGADAMLHREGEDSVVPASVSSSRTPPMLETASRGPYKAVCTCRESTESSACPITSDCQRKTDNRIHGCNGMFEDGPWSGWENMQPLACSSGSLQGYHDTDIRRWVSSELCCPLMLHISE